MQNIKTALSYDDVLLSPRHSEISSRSEIDLNTQITPRVCLDIPLISINMTDVTEEKMAIAMGKLGGLGFLHRFNQPEKQADMVSIVKKANVVAAAAIGVRNGYIKWAEMLAEAGVDIITIDVAHGAMQQAIDATKKLKQTFGKHIDIISGVIATYEGAKDLFLAGADSVRVGVGPGTICTTRIMTGCGVPQITAVMDAARAAKQYNKTVICDGGTKNSGDMMKGLAAGAMAVVSGSQFAGTDEAPGRVVVIKGKKYKRYNASTSYTEKVNHKKFLSGLKTNYTQHVEGVESYVSYKGPVEKVINNMIANIKSGFSYCGAKNITELHKRAEFIRITAAGFRESNAHDVLLYKP